MMAISVYGLSDCGRVRDHNEDAFLIEENLNLFGVADGLGGLQAGEVASQTALKELRLFISAHKDAPSTDREDVLKRAFAHINKRVMQLARQRDDHKGMATTLTACWMFNYNVHIVHAGDSAVFLIRGAKLKRLTREHTLKAAVTEGLVSAPKSSPRIWEHILTRCIGYRAEDTPDTMQVKLHDEDVLLLCSDGLLRYVDSDELTSICRRLSDLPAAAHILIDLANTKGGLDNITVVLLKISSAVLAPTA